MENTLTKVMSDEALLKLKSEHKENVELCKMVDETIAERKRITEEIALATKFRKESETIVEKLPKPPANIYNMYFRYAECEVEDTTKPKETVTIVDTPAITNEGAIIVPAVTHAEQRHPTTKMRKWVMDVNVAPESTSSSTKQKHLKRRISVVKLNGDRVENIGLFDNASQACDMLKLDVGGDSATRVLQRNDYIVRPT